MQNHIIIIIFALILSTAFFNVVPGLLLKGSLQLLVRVLHFVLLLSHRAKTTKTCGSLC